MGDTGKSEIDYFDLISVIFWSPIFLIIEKYGLRPTKSIPSFDIFVSDIKNSYPLLVLQKMTFSSSSTFFVSSEAFSSPVDESFPASVFWYTAANSRNIDQKNRNISLYRAKCFSSKRETCSEDEKGIDSQRWETYRMIVLEKICHYKT